mmetsp:Transcript_32658/g.49219  ORF Transcript_32658/g.49219 Transcript_32658/m.49219 type:complete len:99 (-) Transcript_32658:50-346(-)
MAISSLDKCADTKRGSTPAECFRGSIPLSPSRVKALDRRETKPPITRSSLLVVEFDIIYSAIYHNKTNNGEDVFFNMKLDENLTDLFPSSVPFKNRVS